jgi:hypothetical protein
MTCHIRPRRFVLYIYVLMKSTLHFLCSLHLPFLIFNYLRHFPSQSQFSIGLNIH